MGASFWSGSAIALAILAICAGARANVGAMTWNPGMTGLTAVGGTVLEVEREVLTFDCRSSDGDVVCDFEARYEIRNPGDEPERAAAAFYGYLVSEVEIAVDGVAPVTELPDDVMLAVRDAVDRVEEGLPGPAPIRGPLEQIGFVLEVDAGQRREILVTGRVAPSGLFEPGYQISASRARHLVLGSAPQQRPVTLVYPLAPLETWAAVGEIEIAVRYADDLDVVPSFVDRPKEGRGDPGETPDSGWQQLHDSGAESWRYRGPYEGQDYLFVQMERSAPEVLHGGPLLRIGGSVQLRKSYRAGVGYEIAVPEWLFYAVHVETDFRQDVVIVPTLRAASSWLILLPWGAFSLGAPILVRPGDSAAIGIRAEISIGWGPIALAVPFDFQPMLEPDDPYRFQIGIFGQVSI